MNYSKLFDSKMKTSQLSLLYFKYCDKVEEVDKEDFETAFENAYNKAEEREMKEALDGIFG